MSYNNNNPQNIAPRLRSARNHPGNEAAQDGKPEITSTRLLRTSFFYQTKEFFNNSTLPGVRYIAEPDRPFAERLMWFCFTMIGLISTLVIIVSLWEKFQTNPTITGLDMDVHSQTIVFPTIVVCPHKAYDSNRTHDLAYVDLGNYNESYVDAYEPFLKQLTQLNFETMGKAFESTKKLTGDATRLSNTVKANSLRSLTFQANILCNDVFDTCKYRDEVIECCDHFQQIYSEHGFCFAFNSRYIDQPDAGTENKNFHELFETDKKWALHLTLKESTRVFVHSHQEHFGWDYRPHLYDSAVGAELLISMKQTYTTEEARQLSVGQRKCLFIDEWKLNHFDQEYTFTGCMIECRMRKSIELCGCIPPFYRQIPSKPYCTVPDMRCLAKFASNISNIRSCGHCELSCANTVYDIEKLSKASADAAKDSDNFVNIEFLTWPIIRYKREVLFGWVDLLVSFGGIAGLLMGFSLLSGVEIIYYFTMRTFCMLYKNRQELYEIEEEKMSQPLKQINLSLSLIKPTSDKDDKKDETTPRQVEITEINSRVEPPNQSDAVFGPNNVLRGNQFGQLYMTRAAKKIASVYALNRMNRVATSYDYADTNGPYYMP